MQLNKKFYLFKHRVLFFYTTFLTFNNSQINQSVMLFQSMDKIIDMEINTSFYNYLKISIFAKYLYMFPHFYFHKSIVDSRANVFKKSQLQEDRVMA